jgi:hypothetical protein
MPSARDAQLLLPARAWDESPLTSINPPRLRNGPLSAASGRHTAH